MYSKLLLASATCRRDFEDGTVTLQMKSRREVCLEHDLLAVELSKAHRIDDGSMKVDEPFLIRRIDAPAVKGQLWYKLPVSLPLSTRFITQSQTSCIHIKSCCDHAPGNHQCNTLGLPRPSCNGLSLPPRGPGPSRGLGEGGRPKWQWASRRRRGPRPGGGGTH